jgi:hypothetical protein
VPDFSLNGFIFALIYWFLALNEPFVRFFQPFIARYLIDFENG